MSIHKDCGEHVKWVRRTDEDDRWFPPLESIGHVYVIIDDQVVETIGYRHHKCDPAKMKAWLDYLAIIGELKGDTSELDSVVAHQAARDRQAESTRKYAERVACPQCNQGINEPCVNMSILKKTGELEPTKNPHQSRIDFSSRENIFKDY